jgi:hypothetical protein
MKDRFCPGVATGLPWISKPLLAAVSCGEPGAGEPSGCVSCALGTGTAAGPGGGSSGPARPQAESARTHVSNVPRASPRAIPLIPAPAGIQCWVPAFHLRALRFGGLQTRRSSHSERRRVARTSGRANSIRVKQAPRATQPRLSQRNGRATLCRPNLAGALGFLAGFFAGFLAEPFEPTLRLPAYVTRCRSAIDLPAFDRIGHREHIEYRFRDPRLDRLHGLER